MMRLSKGKCIYSTVVLLYVIAMLFVLPFKVWLVGVVVGVWCGSMLDAILSACHDGYLEEE